MSSDTPLTLDDLRRLETEFNSHAKRMREIHDKLRSHHAEEVPVQSRFFFYSCVVELPMSDSHLEPLGVDPNEVNPNFVKSQIDLAITDETPFYLKEYSGYCSEVVGP